MSSSSIQFTNPEFAISSPQGFTALPVTSTIPYVLTTGRSDSAPLSTNPAGIFYTVPGLNQQLLTASSSHCASGCMSNGVFAARPDPTNPQNKPLYSGYKSNKPAAAYSWAGGMY